MGTASGVMRYRYGACVARHSRTAVPFNMDACDATAAAILRQLHSLCHLHIPAHTRYSELRYSRRSHIHLLFAGDELHDL